MGRTTPGTSALYVQNRIRLSLLVLDFWRFEVYDCIRGKRDVGKFWPFFYEGRRLESIDIGWPVSHFNQCMTHQSCGWENQKNCTVPLRQSSRELVEARRPESIDIGWTLKIHNLVNFRYRNFCQSEDKFWKNIFYRFFLLYKLCESVNLSKFFHPHKSKTSNVHNSKTKRDRRIIIEFLDESWNTEQQFFFWFGIFWKFITP